MQGKIASQYVDPDGTYGELQVMKSPAGYYIGTVFHHKDGYDEPGSRESEYFQTKELAENTLKEKSWNQRLHP